MKHRDDLQGLRAVAVLVVVISHAGVRHFTGGYVGVDVFFVLSGFLITGLLLNEARKTGSVSLSEFYVRRVRRILPAAALTLVATEAAAYYLLNYVRAKQVMWDGIWSAFFGANVHFARIGTDYFARDQPPSPLQHFWTLAVEEQFYLVWPALLGLVLFGLVLRRSRRTGKLSLRRHDWVVTARSQRRLLTVLAVAVLASLAWSIIETRRLPAMAYFSTFTRAWELGLGACLAIAAQSLGTISRWLRATAGWAGVFAIIAATIFYSEATPFPGYAALLPTVGAALVIAAGVGEESRYGVGRLLSVAPMRYVGDRSYTLYLWHWPVLVIVAQYEGRQLSVPVRLALIAAAFALSVVTYRFYENPIRRAEWSGQAIATVGMGAVAATVVFAAFSITALQSRETAAAAGAAPVAAVITPAQQAALDKKLNAAAAKIAAGDAVVLPTVARAVDAARRGAPIPAALNPSPGTLLNSEYQFPSGCAAGDGQTSSRICRLGSRAKRLMVVFGDSHAQMWMPAILSLAETEGWAVTPLDKSGCIPAKWWTAGECHTWLKWALRVLEALSPQVVLVGAEYTADDAHAGQEIGNLTATIRHSGRRVVVLANVPQQPKQPVDCLLARRATLSSCMTTFTGPVTNPAVFDFASASGAAVIDPTGWFCDSSVCPMVIGRTVAYQDRGHITAVYAAELARPFRAAFDAAIKQRE